MTGRAGRETVVRHTRWDMAEHAEITLLDVVPDERGKWRVVEQGRPATLSEHASATEAELMAWSRCKSLDACVIVVHDRYGRTRPVSAWTAPAARASAHDENPDLPPAGLA